MSSSKIVSLVTLGVVLTFSLPAAAFVRGDVNGGGGVDISDAIFILNALFLPGSTPIDCADAGDVNDDGAVNVADAVYLLSALFVPGAAAIPPPYPADGSDPTPDALPDCDLQGLLPFTTLSQGQTSGINAFTQDVISDETVWIAFWAQHSSDPPPAVDFDQEMVVVILGTFGGAGVTYNVDELEVIGTTLEIRYTLTLPGVYYPVLSQPHHFVLCPRTNAIPQWIETVIALP